MLQKNFKVAGYVRILELIELEVETKLPLKGAK
jgi:hypothetical protein